jgi:hypothetical protein
MKPTAFLPCPYRKLDPSVAVMNAADHGFGNDPAKPRDRSADRRVLTVDRPSPRPRLGGRAVVLQRQRGGRAASVPFSRYRTGSEAVRLTVTQCGFNMTVSFVSRVALISNGTSPVRSPTLTMTYLPSVPTEKSMREDIGEGAGASPCGSGSMPYGSVRSPRARIAVR